MTLEPRQYLFKTPLAIHYKGITLQSDVRLMAELPGWSDGWILSGVRAGISEGSHAHRARTAERSAQPDADGDDEPTLPVSAVARRLGVAPATLRTWDRRYGLGPSGHTGGKHRRYSSRDITRLETMQRALLSGVSTAEAAKYALETADGAARVPVQQSVPEPSAAAVELPRLARGLSSAAFAMDLAGMRQLLGEAVDGGGPARTWRDVVEPVLAAIDGKHHSRRPAPHVAQLLRDVAVDRFARISPHRTLRREAPVLLVADDAQVTGGLYAMAAELGEQGLDPVVTTASATAPGIVVELARGITPVAVVVLATKPLSGDLFDELRRGRRHLRLFACGSGWEPVDVPSTVERLEDVVAAVERVCFVLLGD